MQYLIRGHIWIDRERQDLQFRFRYILAESFAVVGYLSALLYAVIATGTYVSVAEFGLIILAGIVLEILARRSASLRPVFLILLNTSFFLLLCFGIAFFLDLFNLISLPFGNIGYTFWVPFGAYTSLNLVYKLGFSNRKHLYVFAWIDDHRLA